MQDFDPGLLKAHFAQLVDAIGTQDAAAAFLGVSRQRVGQLISTSNNDLPTWGQVWKLERACGRSLVFGAFAHLIEEETRGPCAMAAAVEASRTSAAALTTIYEGAADHRWEPHEVEAAQERARENLEAAQNSYAAAMALQPTHRVVQ
ncbi:hypothetical protein ACFPIF_10335 [Brevundimonas faecalis]|uniref:hypothetical protein n=1 Tax=Brevundimonas faecalis TaxID=947378 RepID=UPI0036151A96